MRIVRSTIAADEVLHVIRNRYGFSSAGASCTFEYRGVNDVYKFTNGKTCTFLKLYARSDIDAEAIQAEVEIVNSLKQSGLAVAYAIPTLDEQFIIPFETPERIRFGVLFSEAEGTACVNDVLKDDDVAAIGRLTATMHSLLDRLPTSLKRWKLDEGLFLDRSMQILEEFGRTNNQVDLPFLREVAAHLKDQIEKNKQNWKWGLCHGDFYAGNIHKTEQNKLTLIDFDFCGYGWRAYDVSPFLGNFGWGINDKMDEKRKRRLDHFLRGYQTANSLSDAEVDAVYKVFVPYRRIFNMGYLFDALLYVWGNKLRSEQINQDLRLLKDWVDYYW